MQVQSEPNRSSLPEAPKGKWLTSLWFGGCLAATWLTAQTPDNTATHANPAANISASRPDHSTAGPPMALDLQQGWLQTNTADLELRLTKAGQILISLRPRGSTFDFLPSDQLEFRARPGFHHWCDIILRVRPAGESNWTEWSSARAARVVHALESSPGAIAVADLDPSLPSDFPVSIRRTWAVDQGHLVLRFDLRNRANETVEIGGLALPAVFNNLIHNFVTRRARSLEETHETCVFFDPYPGCDAGYVQVTRLNGEGPALLVIPWGQTSFEAWQPLREPARPMQTFEGTFAWTVHSRAWTEQEWSPAEPWNPPTSIMLAPGETRSYGLRFVPAGDIRDLDAALMRAGRPVAVGVPGYILPMDLEGQLFLHYGQKVREIKADPPGAIEVIPFQPPSAGWQAWRLKGRHWGRARLTVTYDDGLRQTIHYYVIKPMPDVVADLGRFLFTRQWFEDANDPFGRSPSVMSYDRETDRILTQENRVWIAGLSDEGGAGSWIAAACKLFAQPDPDQVQKFERFVNEVLWGRLQYSEGDLQYGVRKSLFYYTTNDIPGFTYDPALDWRSWTSWSEQEARSVGRGYNYPHVVIAYWTLYRLARYHPGLVQSHPWEWFLDQAWQTVMFLTSRTPEGRARVGYVNWGLMQGSVFVELLRDLQREGWADKANAMEQRMRQRAERWARQPYPFGSEMAWDSTGQEEVYLWCKYFGFDRQARTTLQAILGYMPTLPHWGYNGSARRYWDFLYAGKIRRIERQLHHYGSGLNAIPVLHAYREHPADLYLLRVGYGGALGPLSNVDPEGFASAAFHSFPDSLRWDPYTGDYGLNFFGHVMTIGTYVARHPDWGWIAFGGEILASEPVLRVRPRDSLRQRFFLAPEALWLTLDAGRFDTVEYDPGNGRVRIALAPAEPFTPAAHLRIETTAPGATRRYQPATALPVVRGAFQISLSKDVTQIDLIPEDR
ncbi:DUF5695 domain-containing protein [Limisphaera ngatamarikiensis]|nr:DUF5695 domain-containing protein [Limisphaera ngatamarikiensis]